MPEDIPYSDRLFDEIAQWGNRARNTLRGPDGLYEVLKNWTTPYETPERRDEAMRLAAQQAKEEYMAQQNAGQLSLKDARESQAIRENIGRRLQELGPDTAYLAEQERLRMQAAKEGYMAQQGAAQSGAQIQPSIPGLEDPYLRYLQENQAEIQTPGYDPLTREEFSKYVTRGQAPEKAVPVAQQTPISAIPVASGTMTGVAEPSALQVSTAMPQTPIAAAAAQAQQERPITIREKINALPFEADRQQATRKVIEQTRLKTFNEALRYVAETYGIETSQGQNALKTIKDNIDENLPLPKPFEETPQYKSAEKNWEGGLRESRKRISFNIAQAQKAQELMDKDPREALIHMRSNLIKPLNSILSNDAIQLSEMIVRYPDLLSGAEMSQLGGKKLLNPTTIANKFLSLDESVQQNIVEKFTSALAEANPQRFLETAINGINGYVKSYNSDLIDQVINPTSPTIARQLGATPLEFLQNRQPKNALPQTYPGEAIQTGAQAMPFGAPPPGAVRLKKR